MNINIESFKIIKFKNEFIKRKIEIPFQNMLIFYHKQSNSVISSSLPLQKEKKQMIENRTIPFLHFLHEFQLNGIDSRQFSSLMLKLRWTDGRRL